MQLKILYTATLILCLSALASSHECSRRPCTRSEEPVKLTAPNKEPLTIQKEEVMEYSLLRTLYV